MKQMKHPNAGRLNPGSQKERLIRLRNSKDIQAWNWRLGQEQEKMQHSSLKARVCRWRTDYRIDHVDAKLRFVLLGVISHRGLTKHSSLCYALQGVHSA